MMCVSVILLAGGTGSRMNSNLPKQYMALMNKPVVRHSLDLFLTLPEVHEIIAVCDPAYKPIFEVANLNSKIRFAKPGRRRQDSLYNGLQMIAAEANLVCVHDAARPFITETLVRQVLAEGYAHGAATVGMPIKFTVKESDSHHFVKNTPDRSRIWEIQTPQVIRPTLLRKGFEMAIEKELTVSDDVSLAELIHHPVKLVEGSYSNIKITTKEDMLLAECLMKDFCDGYAAL